MGIGIIYLKLKKKKRNYIFYILVLCVLLCGIILDSEANELRINFIDVGEGDSILIQTPKDKAILIDAGNIISGFKVVEYLKEKGINNLEYLILTHPHLDHIGGVFFVLQMIKVSKISDNGENLDQLTASNDLYRWYEELVRHRNDYSVLKADDKFSIDGLNFKIIWPYWPLVFSDFNSNSLAVLLEYKGFKCLLASDLTAKSEEEILKRSDDYKKIDILKVAHHGSKDASEKDFLKALSPKIAIISVNKNNIRRYPSKKILQRLSELGSIIYRTDKDGDITAYVDERRNIRILTEK
ncbi:MAG: ComEC/Rec2 family competence protein [Candidatus Omnitrophica bacterium]|nr:ComEC/Rec2 family competence protein [Candidatus Omnitrophota bacterium]MDD5352355.1 ComEC/Rec2 family competence protein [Candidatus Omnitrophota bacterium]MDD5549953.1 ComEC/Rec2 family competence protein [Candidatus Omnitrophota bacterium]